MTILHTIGDFIRDSLGLIPLLYIRILFVAILVALLVWVLMLPNRETTPPDTKPTWSNNLKTWVTITLLLQIAIYSIF